MRTDKSINVPAIRFQNSDEPWRTLKVKDICSISTGKSNTQDKVTKGDFPFYVRSPIIEHSNRYLFDEEAVLTVGDGVGTGKVHHYVNGKYDLHQRVYRMFNFSDEIYPKYFYYFFSKNFYKRVMSMTAKTSVDSVRLDMIAEMDVQFPSLTEQENIASFLSEHERQIELHSRKHERLVILKRTMLQKMFPQNGAVTPEIRFSGFSCSWVEKTLEELVDLRGGRDYKHLSRGEIPVYGTGGFMLKVDQALSSDDAVGIGRKGTIDKPYLLRAPFWTVDTLFFAIPKGSNNLDFVYCLFQKINWKLKDESTGVPSLSKVAINSVNVLVTSIEEQNKIGEYFNTLDRLILKHETHLTKLKQLKSAFVEKMFA